MIDGFNSVQFCMRFNKSDTNTTVIENNEAPKLTDVLDKLHQKLSGNTADETTATPAAKNLPNQLM